MKYPKLLDKYITDSGLSLRKIASKCHEEGLEIDHSYISKLRRGAMPPASDKVNKVLAKVLNGDSEVLAVSAYREKIPANVLEKLTGTECR